jgi:hypothetical protein
LGVLDIRQELFLPFQAVIKPQRFRGIIRIIRGEVQLFARGQLPLKLIEIIEPFIEIRKIGIVSKLIRYPHTALPAYAVVDFNANTV